jgi:hypothetical protein
VVLIDLLCILRRKHSFSFENDTIPRKTSFPPPRNTPSKFEVHGPARLGQCISRADFVPQSRSSANFLPPKLDTLLPFHCCLSAEFRLIAYYRNCYQEVYKPLKSTLTHSTNSKVLEQHGSLNYRVCSRLGRRLECWSLQELLFPSSRTHGRVSYIYGLHGSILRTKSN